MATTGEVFICDTLIEYCLFFNVDENVELEFKGGVDNFAWAYLGVKSVLVELKGLKCVVFGRSRDDICSMFAVEL